MNRLLLALFCLVSVVLPMRAADKGAVLIHQGETIYARFDTKGKKLKLISYAKEKDDNAQVIFTLGPDPKKPDVLLSLKVQNKLPRDLLYKLEMRSLTAKLKFQLPEVSPVVSGKVAFETFPKQADEVAAFDFQLDQ